MKLIFLTFSFFFISCSQTQDIQNITTKELKALMNKSVIQLLDVRTHEEVKQGAIETAFFVDFYSDDFSKEASKILDKNKPVYIYCRSGNRSRKAARLLQDKGFRAINVLGGYNQWKQKN